MKLISFEHKENITPYDLQIKQVGYEVCEPSHHYGPSVREHYLVHYVKSGKGVFRYDDNEISLKRDELFLIYPGEVTYYKADSKKPWEYYWFGFSGKCSANLLKTAGFSQDNRKVKYNLGVSFSISETIAELADIKILNQSSRIYETAKFYEIFSWLIKSCEQKNKAGSKIAEHAMLEAAVQHINRSYMLDIKVSDIAKHIGVDRTQLYRYFIKGYEISPQQFIINHRMNAAKKLLADTNLKIKQVAYSVGYGDEYLFSKMFKKTYGLSPKNYRESHL